MYYTHTFFYRSKSIRVFVAGDYELLCKMYGISGATGIVLSITRDKGYIIVCLGRHCCLWCHIDRKNLKSPPSQQQLRSLATLANANADFLNLGGGDLSVVKNYYNVLSLPFFSIPLDQVGI